MRLIARGAIAAAGVLALAGSACAGPASAGPDGARLARAAAARPRSFDTRALRAMPAGQAAFGRDRSGRLTVRASVSGLTPGSSHSVDLIVPGVHRQVRFTPLTATSAGWAVATLRSTFTGHLPPRSRLVIRLGTGAGPARLPIAVTGPLAGFSRREHRLIAVETGPAGRDRGTPAGRATVSYSTSRHTLTVTVHAVGLTPGLHAAHIHLGSCHRQGAVVYMLPDLVADRNGIVRHAVSVFTNVRKPLPAQGWYLNIHQGNSGNILRSGAPAIFFRPLLCADIGRP